MINKSDESYKVKKLEPFVAPDSREISDEEKIKDALRMKRAAEIGIYLNVFDEEEHDNPYRAQALVYITKDMDVPEELKKKIREYDVKYNKQISNSKAVN